MPQTLESLIEKEYDTVQKEREDLLAKRTEIDDKLRALDRRLDAAANYKATLEGKFVRPTRAPAQRKATTAPALHAAQAGRCRRKSSLSSSNSLTARPPISSTQNSTPLTLKRRSPSLPLCSG